MRSPRPLAAAAAAVAAASLLAACGSSAPSNGPQMPMSQPSTRASVPPSAAADAPSNAAPEPETSGLPLNDPIAQTRGDDGIVGLIYRVERRDGIVTVSAGARNDGYKNFYASAWGYSLKGSSLVDRRGKRRYLTLQDAKGTCLCTKIKRIIEPGETRLLHASFPAPPESTTEVDLQLANMQPVVITIPAE
ncbi:hypothetical protein [Streptomyces sp. NPDC059783]|uniref:hypothetical protein n=1 Tax=Streptomyces sp. NPDC059783 TaxID=3346944 RepID=UPI00365F7E9E